MTAITYPTIRVYNANGGLLPIMDRKYCIPRPFDRVKRSTTVKDIFVAVSHAVQWPREFMQLRIGDKAYDFPILISKQKHLETFVMSLISYPHQTFQDAPVGIIVFYDLRMPTDFNGIYCLCDFGGCCRLCNVPSNQICKGCGNNGCCRVVECGCDCCEDPNVQPQRRCPILGCRPKWAQC